MTYGTPASPPSGITQAHQYPPSYNAATDAPEQSSPPPPFSTLSSGDGENKEVDAAVSVREVMRTPSPTPTEARALSEKTRTCNPKKLPQLLHWRRFTTKRGAWTGIAGICILVFLIAFLAYQSRIEDKLLPFSDWLRDTPGAWLIFIALLFVLSFPPLFGHELVGILCGDVWGVWLGFAIFAAGTVLGELGNFYVFKWFCMARGRKLEEKQLKWALYAQVVREGGLKVPVIMRFSLIPSHFTTAIFSLCGMNVWIYLASAILSLPKQLAVVYVGVAQNNPDGTPTTSGAKAIKAGVIIFTALVTVFAMRYIDKKVDEVKHRVVYARRKGRQVKALAAIPIEADDSNTPAVLAPVPRTEFPSMSTSDALSSGVTPLGVESVMSPSKRHFHAPQPSTGNAHDHGQPVIYVHAPVPDLPAGPGPAHPTRVRTAMGVRGADVDLEMGVKRGRSLDTARATQATATVTAGRPGRPAGLGQVDVGARGVALGRLTQGTPGASTGGRAMGMGGGGQAWSKS